MKKAGRKSPFPQTYALIALLALGAALRVYRLSAQSFWYDESYQVQVSGQPLLRTLRALLTDSPDYGPFSHVLFNLWLRISEGDFWARLLPALCGLLAVYVVYVFCLRICGPRTGLAAAFLLAISPIHIWYSQEARAYSLVVLLNTLSMLYFINSIDPGRRKHRALYVLVSVCALYTHPYAIFTIAAQLLYALVALRRQPSLRLRTLDIAAAVALYLPWAYFMSTMLGRTIGGPKSVGPTVLAYSLYSFTFGYSVGPSVDELHHQASIGSYIPYLRIIAPLAAVYGLLLLRGLAAGANERRIPRRDLLLCAWFAFPLLGAYAASQLTPVTYNVRYVLAALVPYLTFIAMGVASLKRTQWRTIALASLALTSLYSIRNLYTDPRYFKGDTRSAALYLNRAARPGDVVAVVDWRSFVRYYTGEAPWFTMSGEEPQRLLRLGSGAYKRLWLVLAREMAVDPHGQLRGEMRRRYTVLSDRRYPNLHLVCYELEGSAGGRALGGDASNSRPVAADRSPNRSSHPVGSPAAAPGLHIR